MFAPPLEGDEDGKGYLIVNWSISLIHMFVNSFFDNQNYRGYLGVILKKSNNTAADDR